MSERNSNLQLFRPLYRGLPIIIAMAVGANMAAKKYLSYTTPIYESTAKIKLADPHDGVPNSNLFKDLDVFANANKIGAEVELLKSKALVYKVIDRLDVSTSIYRVGDLHKTELYHQAPFTVAADFSDPKLFDKPFAMSISNDSLVSITLPSQQKIATTLNRVTSFNGGIIFLKTNYALLKSKPGITINDRYEFTVHSKERLADHIIADLDVMSVDKDVPVLRISYKSPVPTKSADVVNTLAAVYITDYIDEKYRSADTTTVFLDRQLRNFGGQLAASENAIENYRDKNNIINIRQETETDLRKIADLKKQLASVQMNLNAVDTLNVYMLQGKDRFLELAPNFEAFTDLLSTEMIKKTKELQREKRDLLTKYTSEHEKVKVIDEKLTDIANYIQESIHNTGKALRIKYDDLSNTIVESEKVFTGLPSREKNLSILERNFGLNEQIYRFLHEKKTEAEIARAASISFHRIISAGEIPAKPVSPNTVIIKIMAIILGLFAGIAAIYLVHSLKARVNDESNITKLSSTPVILSIPFFKDQQKRTAFFHKTALQLLMANPPGTKLVICISSFDDMEGKKHTSGGLLEAFHYIGKTVMLANAEEILVGENIKPQHWEKWLEGKKQDHDVIIIKNYSIKNNPSALLAMNSALLNIVLLDSRRTRKQRVGEADSIQRDLSILNMRFAINRAGYTPSLFTQAKQLINIITRKNKS